MQSQSFFRRYHVSLLHFHGRFDATQRLVLCLTREALNSNACFGDCSVVASPQLLGSVKAAEATTSALRARLQTEYANVLSADEGIRGARGKGKWQPFTCQYTAVQVSGYTAPARKPPVTRARHQRRPLSTSKYGETAGGARLTGFGGVGRKPLYLEEQWGLLDCSVAAASDSFDRRQLSHSTEDKLQRLIAAAGLAVHRVAEGTDSGKDGVSHSERASRLLQKLCRCSWAAAMRLLRSKEAFAVSSDRPPQEHMQQIQDHRRRRRIAPDGRLSAGVDLYYPCRNKEAAGSTTGCDRDGEKKRRQGSELVLFADSEFIVVNKPYGLPLQKITRRLPLLWTDSNPAPPTQLESLSNADANWSGAALLCRNRAAAAIARKSIKNGNFGSQRLIAIVDGQPPGRSGRVKIPLRFDKELNAAIPCALHLGGKAAITEWTLLRTARTHACVESPNKSNNQQLSVLALETDMLVTGDQIRAHCAFGLHCPLRGDALYKHLLTEWQRAQQKYLPSTRLTVASECEDPQQSKGEALLPLHIRQIQWKTLEGKDVTVVAPLNGPLLTCLKACGLPDVVAFKPASKKQQRLAQHAG
ncbi:hypothetical protein Efla_000043 [Eimeria flavescens]